MSLRFDWKIEELQKLYELPLLELISKSHAVRTQYFDPSEIQVCTLLSIKTGGCPEDCKYCAQSSHYKTQVTPQSMMKFDEVISKAKKAKENGVTRICLGAAWRQVRDGLQFDEVLRMIKGITNLDMEVCVTLGMLQESHAIKLKNAGLYAYSHNLDTSEKYYKTIITTRTYQDRLNTLQTARNANLKICCGGILGLGESIQDRLELLHTLCTQNPHPESVPINRLSRVPGTPLENQPSASFWELIRIVAIARLVLPKAMIRLSAGRKDMSYEQQALCFLAGANSIHTGEKLLTVENTSRNEDEKMFELFGLKKRPGFASGREK